MVVIYKIRDKGGQPFEGGAYLRGVLTHGTTIFYTNVDKVMITDTD